MLRALFLVLLVLVLLVVATLAFHSGARCGVAAYCPEITQ